MNTLFSALLQLLYGIPELVAWSTCLAVALSRRDKHPTVSTLAASAAGLNLALWAVGAFFRVLLYSNSPLLPMNNVQLFSTVSSVLTSIGGAAAFGMVSAAAFGWREPGSGRSREP